LQKVFSDWEFICVADNCDQELLQRLKSDYKFNAFYETQLGNPGSFWKLYQIAQSQVSSEDIIYFVEDDYLHLPEASDALIEGLSYFEYVTVYDHPDKYQLVGKVVNPYAKKNRYSETTQVVLGKKSIWRISNSTTMTFALKGKTLIEDADIWSLTGTQKGDYDFEIFTTLTQQPILWRKRYIKFIYRKLKHLFKAKRYLGVSCPGLALHLEMAYISNEDINRFELPIK
jgi:glycosyltransferase involved in cell wall biosynthesis